MWEYSNSIIEQASFVASLDVWPFALSGHAAVFLALVLFVICRALRCLDPCEQPQLFHSDSSHIAEIVSLCPSLRRSYMPPKLWGKSGHIQTLLLSKFGRFYLGDNISGSRKTTTLRAADGASVVYDFFRSTTKSKAHSDATILVVPGIGNHVDTVYVQAFTRHCLAKGYDVVIYNHLGAARGVELTSPRVFTYGGTDDLCLVVDDLRRTHGVRHLLGIGFSMGANILLKYLGEQPERQALFRCAVSVCQGYDIARASELFLQWDNLRRGYNYIITQVMKSMLMRHANALSQSTSPPLNDQQHWQSIRHASSLHHLDNYIGCFDGFDSVDEFYKWSSSCRYMPALRLPVLMINAQDDPMVPDVLLTAPKHLVACNPHSCLVVSKHGGHLGFFEGGFVLPNHLSWMDRVLLEYIDAISSVHST